MSGQPSAPPLSKNGTVKGNNANNDTPSPSNGTAGRKPATEGTSGANGSRFDIAETKRAIDASITDTSKGNKISNCVMYTTENCANNNECALDGNTCISTDATQAKTDKQLKHILPMFGYKADVAVDHNVINDINEQINILEDTLKSVKSTAESRLNKNNTPDVFKQDNIRYNSHFDERLVNSLDSHINGELSMINNAYNATMESTYKVLIGRIELMQHMISDIKRIKSSKRDIDRTMRKSLLTKLMYTLQGTQTLMRSVMNASVTPNTLGNVTSVIGGK